MLAMTRQPHLRKTGVRTTAAMLLLSSTILGLVGCNSPREVVQSTWQITNVYTKPGTPSGLPDTVAGSATMVFGESTVAGFTGCSPFQGQVKFTKDGSAAPAAEADHVEFIRIEMREPECSGKERFYHDALAEMLQGGFSITHDGDELVFTQNGEDIDRPGFRLVD
ncbi:META domain-containing protein [Corynebacterium freiburgense]|uniref:META domain-containing protein n=1 Tax=Corynebacterium freiburgense TaxID=556548 RepID=UPI0003FE8A58|nr:META domain-containing protein [Corynebacterium freiburgense]WJZ03642.1 hypothetical protein CFREI_11925 [Corynebacterium freiburgense]